MLPEGFADDPERHARFEREARVLASLNHPNIATLYGLEHLDDRHVLVMELVEGEDLAERIARGPIPVDEAIPIALQIAEALEAAHEEGIVHRDLKPANIQHAARRHGQGARLRARQGLGDRDRRRGGLAALADHHPARTRRAGVILGTAAYMSPEQARGRPVDRRADIWAFGVVLWEMLTGRKLFEGETVSDVLAAVLTRDPEPSALPAKTPASVERLIARCLTRDLRSRLQWIGDARLDLAAGHDEPLTARDRPHGGLLRWAGVALAAVTATSLLSMAALNMLRSDAGPPVGSTTRLEVTGMTVASASHVAISPDGTRIIAYDDSVIPPRLTWRNLDAFEVQPVPGPISGFNPFFAPDGAAFGYFATREVCIGTLTAGAGRCLAPAEGFATGDWGADGTIVFSNEPAASSERAGLWAVSSSGGAPRQLTRVDFGAGEISHTYPHRVHGGEEVLFTIRSRDGWSLAAVSLAGGEPRPVLANAVNGRVLPSGHLVFADAVAGGLHAVPFSLDRLEVRGEPVEVQRNLTQTGDAIEGFDLSDNGTLVYSLNDLLDQGFEVVQVDREGRAEPLIDELGSWTQPRVSPNGRLVVVRRTAQPDCHLWVFDVVRRSLSRLTFDSDNHGPLWFASSDRIVCSRESGPSLRREAVWLPADGSGTPQPLFDPLPDIVSVQATAISRDGRFVALADDGKLGRDDIVVYDRELGVATPFLTSRFDEEWPMFSPDGRWLAYSSNETGRYEVYVRRFPEGDSKHLLSTHGGRGPIWSPNGRELFFAEGKRLMAVAVRTEPELSAGQPEPLFGGDEYIWSRVRNYDVLPDGSGFVIVRSGGGQAPLRSLRVVINWVAELERLAPSRGGKR